MVRIYLVDDHDLVRRGLRRLLDDISDFQVVGEADTAERALEELPELSPHVVLMDVGLPGISGLEATRRLKRQCPAIQVIILTVQDRGPMPRHLLAMGVAGYLSKGSPFDDLVQAVRTAALGGRHVSPDVAQNLALSGIAGKDALLDECSPQEIEVARMTVQGLSTQEIAARMYLSCSTVSTYRSRLYRKLGIRSGMGLVQVAVENGWFEGATVAEAKSAQGA